jgi:hypothetical protein
MPNNLPRQPNFGVLCGAAVAPGRACPAVAVLAQSAATRLGTGDAMRPVGMRAWLEPVAGARPFTIDRVKL